MKFTFRNINLKIRALRRWHKWFAWYPVKVKSKLSTKTSIVWLKTVKRRCLYCTGWDGFSSWVKYYKEL